MTGGRSAGRVRLRDAGPPPGNGTAASGGPLPPLQISGIVVRKAVLVEALRVYVPGLVDIATTEDGEHFWLMLREGGTGDDPTAAQET